jgi:DNA repair protein RadD
VRTRQGDYVVSDLSQKACDDELVEGAVTEFCALAANRQRWLVFCVDVAHTELVTDRLRAHGIACAMVVGTTPPDDRAAMLAQFRAGALQALVGCEVFTEGFNVPAIDAVILLRPTKSRSLMLQMCGRGCRQAPEKRDCVIIDLSDNLERHAPLDAIPQLEKSPARARNDAARERKAAEARERVLAHKRQASTRDPFDDDATPTALVRGVLRVSYELQPSQKYPGKTNLVASYLLDGPPKWVRQWICLEYPGSSRWHALQWYTRRGLPMPATAAEALQQARAGCYPTPHGVVLEPDGRYMRVVLEQFGQEDAGPDDLFNEESYAASGR